MAISAHKFDYKLYQPDGTFIATITNDVISQFQVSKTINGGVGNLKVTLNRPIDNYDEYDSVKNPNGAIKYGNRVKVYLNDSNNTNKLMFYGYLVAIGPEYGRGEERVVLTFYGAISKLSNDYYTSVYTPPDTAGFYKQVTSLATSAIITDIIDNYNANVANSMLSYTGGSIDGTGNSVTYTFDAMRHLESLRKIAEYLPSYWYWYIDGAGVVYVKDSQTQPEHKLILGKHITEIKSHKTAESVLNYFIMWNGRSLADASYVYKTYADAGSQSIYDRVTLFQQDSEVLHDSVADVRGNAVIDFRKHPKEHITIEVGDQYDLASIEPGHMVSIRNIKDNNQTTFADGLMVIRVSYTPESALIEVATPGAELTKYLSGEEDAYQLSIRQSQRDVEQIQAGSTPITEANIEYSGSNFITQDIITGYTNLGNNVIGLSGTDAIVRSYGKTGFDNSQVGYWLQKDTSNNVKFELYYDSDNYIKFDGAAGTLNIAGDIVLGPGTTITWSQISDAVVPNVNSLTDASWVNSMQDLIDGNVSGGTFISSTTVYSPTIAGYNGYFINSIRVGAPATGGIIKSYNKTNYGDGTPGFLLEYTAGGVARFELYTSGTQYLRWNGSFLAIRGNLNADDVIAGTLTGRTVQTTATANRGIKMTSSYLRGWDSSGVQRFNLDANTGIFRTNANIAGTVGGGNGITVYNNGGSNVIGKMNEYGVVIKYQNAFSAASNTSGDLGNDWFRFLCDKDTNWGTFPNYKVAGIIEAPQYDNIVSVTNYLGVDYFCFYPGTNYTFQHLSTYYGDGSNNLGDNTITGGAPNGHYFGNTFTRNVVATNADLELWVGSGKAAVIKEGGNGLWKWYNQGGEAFQESYKSYCKIKAPLGITLDAGGTGGGIWLNGIVWKAGGGFVIDHPHDPQEKFLAHSFVESPDMVNIYRGKGEIVSGECKITMPSWFTAVNGKEHSDFSYALTSIGQQNDLWVKTEINNDREIIFAGTNDGTFSYIITAIRQDPWAINNRVPIEMNKADVGKTGEYIHPEIYDPNYYNKNISAKVCIGGYEGSRIIQAKAKIYV